jgi:hypothetical protein
VCKAVKNIDMGLTSLIFRDTVKVKADYGTIVSLFKLGLNRTYYKGYIDKDETQLFYFSGFFKRPLSANLPLIQINFEDRKAEDGQLVIKFKIVNFALVLFGLANGIILLFSIVDLDPYKQNRIPPGIPLLTFALSYGFLLFMYLIEWSEFKREIRRLPSPPSTQQNL